MGVLISGRGSNLAALAQACAQPDFPAEIVLVLSNVESVGGLDVADQWTLPFQVISHKDFSSRETFDAALDAALQAAEVDIVCAAGFMRIHSDSFVRKWEGRLINIHPSLLPSFKGIRVHQQALDAGVKISGCTVHFVVPELDSGPIIAQAAVPVMPEDTAQHLAARILEAEHRLYPNALRDLATGRVTLRDGRAVFL